MTTAVWLSRADDIGSMDQPFVSQKRLAGRGDGGSLMMLTDL